MKRKTRKKRKLNRSGWKTNLHEAYQAAVMLTQGKATGEIAVALFKSKATANLNRVGSLLRLAEREGIFSLAGQLDHAAAARLKTWCNNDEMNLYVVKNDHLAYTGDAAVDEAERADAVARKAAEVVAGRIAVLLKKYRHQKKRRIVIANAGGYAVSRIVHFLPSHRLIPEETNPRQLNFISLNSASLPTDYGRSANVSAVRMAQIYGGSHIARSRVWPALVAAQYDHDVLEANIDLLICGAGSRNGLLFTWLQQHAGVQLTPSVIGDICLIPISRDGHEVTLDEVSLNNLHSRLDIKPLYSDLHSLAGRNAVIFVPMGFRHPASANDADGSTPEHSKLDITRAILKHSLTHTCVLSNTLANAIVDAPDPATPPA